MGVTYLFGECGCCRGALSAGAGGEFQEVYASIKYPLGNRRIYLAEEFGAVIFPPLPAGSLGGMVGNSPTQIPTQCYLGYGDEWTHSDGTVVYGVDVLINRYDGIGDTVSQIDIRSEKPFDGSGPTINTNPSETELVLTYSNGAKIRYFVHTPYTYVEAVAEAVAMLEKVTLLDPLAEYTSWMDGKKFRFCYPSEAAGYGYFQNITFNGATLMSFFNDGPGPNYLSRVYLTWQLTRDYLGPSLGYGPVKSQEIVCAPNSQLDGQPGAPVLAQAVNGMSYKAFPGTYYNGYIWATKSAARVPYDLKRRGQFIWDGFSQKFPPADGSGVRYFADAKPGGEIIFMPSDVPGFGECFWDTGALPGLPG